MDHVVAAAGGEDSESEFIEGLCDFEKFGLVTIADGQEHGAFERKLHLFGCFCSLEVGFAEGFGETEHFAGGAHFRPKDWVNFWEVAKWEDGFFDAVVRNDVILQRWHWGRIAGERRGHDLGGDLYHVDVADLGNEWYGAGSAWICFEHVDFVVFDGVLHVHETAHIHFNGDLSRVILDGGDLLVAQILGRQDASGVARVHTSELDVFHDGWYKAMFAVGDGVCFAFGGVVEEAVDEDRTVWCDADSSGHVDAHLFVVMNDFHAASAEHVAWAYHNWIADAVCCFEGFVDIDGHAAFWHWNAEAVHHITEVVAVFGKVDGFWCGAEDVDTVFLEVGCKVERRLTAELSDDADWLLFFVDGEHVFEGERLEIELVGGVVVGGDGLRVAVDDDGFKAELLESEGGMNAAIVKFDPLTDAVWTAAKDHDLWLIGGNWAFVLVEVVGGVVVSCILGAANMNAFPGFADAVFIARSADVVFWHGEDLAQIAIAEAVEFGLTQHAFFWHAAFKREELFFFLNELCHLLEEPVLDLGEGVDLVHGGPFAQRFVDDELAFAGWEAQFGEQLVFGQIVEVLGVAEPVATGFQTANGFLEGFLVGFADGHDFADGFHLGAELVFGAFEFFKGPAGKFDDDIIATWHVFIEGAVFAAWDLFEGETAGEHGAHERDREARRFGSERGGAGGTRVDLDDDDAPALRIVGELAVAAADDFDILNDAIGVILETILNFLADGEHRRRAEGVTGVDAHWVDIFNEANGDDVVFSIAHDFELELFPAGDAFFNEDLTNEAGLETAFADGFEFVDVVDNAAAGAAHGVGWTQHDRIAELVSDLHSFVDAVSDLAACHFDAELFHLVLEFDAVFAAFDGVNLDADDLDAIFFEHACFRKLGAEVEAALTAEVWQERVWAFLVDDLGEPLHVEWFDIGDVGDIWVGHDGGWVGVDQHDLVAELAQRLAGLGAGIVKLAGLADDDRAGTNDHDLMDVL